MRHLALAPVPALLLAALAAPAAALDAETLERDLEAYVEELQVGMPDGALAVGEIAVTEEGAGLRVFIADILLVDPLEGESVEVGDVSFLVDEPETGIYAFSEVELPERLSILGPGGEERGSLTFDLDRFSGIFSADLGELTALDLLVRGLELRVPAEGLVVALAETSGRIETLPEAERREGDTAAARHRQTQSYRLAGLVVSDPEATVEFGEIVVGATIEGLDLEVYRTFMAIIGDLETAADQGDMQRIAGLRQAMGEITHLALLLDQEVFFRDIVAYGPDGTEVMALAEVELGLDVESPLQSESGSASFVFAGSGFRPGPAIAAEAGDFVELIPTDWRLPFRMEKLPLEDLSDAFVDLIFDITVDPFYGDSQLFAAGDTLLSALGKADTRLIVRDLFIDAPLGRTEAKASLAFAPETPLGVVGMAEFVMTGLDKILVYAEGLSDPEDKRWLSAAVLGLMGVGEAVALDDGSVGYRYSFFLTPEGEVSMNGFGFGDMLNEAIPQ